MRQAGNDRLLLDSRMLQQQSPPQKDKPRTKFTEFEDNRLRQIVMSMPKVNWKIVERLMGSKNARQCRERYNNYLAPQINTNPWTPEEEKVLMEKYKELGPQWAKMTPFFSNRAAVSIKNQYAKIIYNERRGKTQVSAVPDDDAEEDTAPMPVDDPVPVSPPVSNPEPKKTYQIHESVAKILEHTDRLGDTWYKMEENARYASMNHEVEEDNDY